MAELWGQLLTGELLWPLPRLCGGPGASTCQQGRGISRVLMRTPGHSLALTKVRQVAPALPAQHLVILAQQHELELQGGASGKLGSCLPRVAVCPLRTHNV